MAVDVLRDNIRQLLRLRDLTQTALAAELQIAGSSVSDFLNGKQGIEFHRLDDLARVLNVTVPDLFTPNLVDKLERERLGGMDDGAASGQVVATELVAELQRAVDVLVGEVARLSKVDRKTGPGRKAKPTASRGHSPRRKRPA